MFGRFNRPLASVRRHLIGTPGRIRTCTVLLLREPPPTGWATGACRTTENGRQTTDVSSSVFCCPSSVVRLVPAGGVEPPTFALRGRCTSVVLSRHRRTDDG